MAAKEARVSAHGSPLQRVALLVGSSRSTSRTVEVMLRSLQYRVMQAKDGEEALSILRGSCKSIGILIMSRHLLEGGGGGILQQITQLAGLKKIPVVTLSSKSKKAVAGGETSRAVLANHVTLETLTKAVGVDGSNGAKAEPADAATQGSRMKRRRLEQPPDLMPRLEIKPLDSTELKLPDPTSLIMKPWMQQSLMGATPSASRAPMGQKPQPTSNHDDSSASKGKAGMQVSIPAARGAPEQPVDVLHHSDATSAFQPLGSHFQHLDSVGKPQKPVVNIFVSAPAVEISSATNAQASKSQVTNELSGDKVGRREAEVRAYRQAAIVRFREKRKQRSFAKKVRYRSRQKVAERRPRVKGQFVKSTSLPTSVKK